MNDDTRLRGGRLRSETTGQTAAPDGGAPDATAPGTAPVVAAERRPSSDNERPRTTPTAPTAPAEEKTGRFGTTAPAATQPTVAGRPVARRPLMRIPGFSPSAPII